MDYIIKYFWLFTLGSFIGFIIETLWCLIRNRKLESRKGLIYGPFTPVYGAAALFITLFIEVFKIKNIILVFFVTFIVCFLVEYIASVFQERCFGTKSWDYSKFPLNINGRVNLLYILAFSAIGLFWIEFYPAFLKYLYLILNKINLLYEVSILAMILMMYNIIISIVASYRQRMRRNGKIANNKLDKWLDEKYNDEYMKRIYANAVVVDKNH